MGKPAIVPRIRTGTRRASISAILFRPVAELRKRDLLRSFPVQEFAFSEEVLMKGEDVGLAFTFLYSLFDNDTNSWLFLLSERGLTQSTGQPILDS
jgi:hypothetical protein